MSEHNLQRLAPAHPVARMRPPVPLGRILTTRGVIDDAQLQQALHLQSHQNAPLGEILVGEGWTNRGEVLDALAEQNGMQIADLKATPPDVALCAMRPVEFWLKNNVIPWMRIGPIVLIATARPDRFNEIRDALQAEGQTFVPVLASMDQIDTAIAKQYSRPLALAAETRVEPSQSCRTWTPSSRTSCAALFLMAACVFVLAPQTGFTVLFVVALITLNLFMMLRFAGLIAFVQDRIGRMSAKTEPIPTDHRLPCVSILVPLYQERAVADVLIRRLRRLTYPRSLLDVILVLEEKDHVTRDALAQIDLPSWVRAIEVPGLNGLTTKPRAMNYALDFCRGEILGVWDAEDAPAPDQIEKVVRRFGQTPRDVVCLQGILDYYNPRTNWRSRCFTIEYCGWFRVILPGIARMGLVMPLGGTTFFFRREVLEELGGWDAHNVTEDADLGVRLCRAGYRSEMIDAVTYEEANFRAWPWVKQRSRWLKGFMVTYLVHMRSPAGLLRDLGVKQFLGVQAFFLGTLGQFLLAPVLWVFWLIFLGLPEPVTGLFSSQLILGCTVLFLVAEALNLLIGVIGVSSRQRRFLIPWVPTMVLYYPLGVVAAYKALWELAAKPFFWDKTEHGHAAEENATI